METLLYWIAEQRTTCGFPAAEQALEEPDGLLAIGGDLGSRRLLEAYRHGIFPWYDSTQPILWWSPNPRSVLFPEGLVISRSLRRSLKRCAYEITIDRSFPEVIQACAEPRKDAQGTWLTPAMIDAYTALHREGHAHSIEAWNDDRLIGGLYGICIGRVFFAESMFNRRPDASKICLVRLAQHLLAWDFKLIDCQVHSQHIERLGARRIPRSRFIAMLDRWCPATISENAWQSNPQDRPPARRSI